MEVYELWAADGFQGVRRNRRQPAPLFDELESLLGATIEHWEPQAVELLDKKLPQPELYGFLPELPVFSQRVVDEIGDVLRGYGQLLPLVLPKGRTAYAYNVTTVIDPIDYERSEVVRYSDGSLMRIATYVFRPEVIGDTRIFELPKHTTPSLICTEWLEQEWKRRGYRGARFELLWSDSPAKL